MTDQEDVSLEALAAQFETQQSQPAQRETESIQPPKFDSPEQGLDWLAQQHSQTRAELARVSETLTKKEQESFVSDQMQALDTAIKTVGKDIELDPALVEGFLHTTYNRDKNFQKIFDNRSKNPAAYEKALGVLHEQLKAKATLKTDPSITENTRALEQLQKSARSGGKESPDDHARGMSSSDFDRYWEKLKAG